MKNFRIYLIIFLLSAVIKLHGQSSNETELVGRWAAGSPNAFTVENNIIYTGNGGILQIIDLSDVNNPILLGQAITDGVINDVAKSNNYVYLAEKGKGIKIIDVSNSSNPIQVSEILLPGPANKLVVNNQTLCAAEGRYIDNQWFGGLRTIDVSDPLNPNTLGFYGSPSRINFIALVGDYVYMDKDLAKMLIIDISNLSNPILIDSVNTSFGGAFVADNLLYAVSEMSNDKGLIIFNVSNPVNPILISQTILPFGAIDVTVSGNYAFITNGVFSGSNISKAGQLRVFDITDPTNPTEIGLYESPGNVDNLSVINNTIIISEGNYFTSNSKEGSGLRIIDITDPVSPEPIGFYELPGKSKYVAVRNKYAFVLTRFGGISVVDIQDISAPTQIGYYNSPGEPLDISLQGNLAYLADANALRIIDISDVTNPVELGSYASDEYLLKVDVQWNFAFVLSYGKGMCVFDISNPSDINKVGFLDLSWLNLASILVEDNYAYIGGETTDHWGGAGYIEIIDIAEPSNPRKVGEYWGGGLGWQGVYLPADLELDGKYLYVANKTYLDILDVSDPTTPVIVSSATAFAKEIEVYKNYTFVSYPSYGLMIFDITDPAAPEFVEFYDKNRNIGSLSISDGEIFAAAGENGVLIFHNDLITNIEKELGTTPIQFSLYQNYPNPFNPTTVIGYQLPVEGFVKLTIYEQLGREITTIVNKAQNAGSYKINFDGSSLASGIYFYKLTWGSFSLTRKMLLLK